jgi:hypothetical protein
MMHQFVMHYTKKSSLSHLHVLPGFSLDNKTTASVISEQPTLQQSRRFAHVSFQLSRA